jgi:rhomboid protease GluP
MLEGYRFWSVAQSFIEEDLYRIVYISEDQNELWLENPDAMNAPIIRLRLTDLNWSNWLERDIQTVAMNGENIRKKAFKRNQLIINIYISPYLPVDSYEINSLAKRSQFDQTVVDTVILSEVSTNAAIEKLESVFNKPFTFLKEDHLHQTPENVKQRTLQLAAQRVQSERNLFFYGKPIFTYIFLVLQIVMFLLLELNGGSKNPLTLVEFGAKFNPFIIEGEWWRFLSPIFLHIGFLHLFMNSLGLYFLGSAVERIYGSFRFFWIYLFSGVIGSIVSFAFSPNLSAGASGAIYGCFGALLYIGLIYPKLFFRTVGKNVITILILNIIISFTVPSIDMAGHLGGLIGGFLATGILHFPKKKKVASQLLFLLLATAATSTILLYGFAKPVDSEASIVQLAQEYVKEEEFEQSYKLLTKFLKDNGNHSEYYYFQLSYVEIQLKKYSDAVDHLNKAISLNPEFHEAHFNLSLLYIQDNKIEEARFHAKQAVELSPSNKNYQEILRSSE